ncbi:MAG: DUF3996 domain-containing protein [Ignavibacteriae bacterium]|nr:DUF3996 domain-containing protein [Ignavibacteriota bacterium]MCB0723710.1 DUF3996 domain-containing protein [Ignavibacteriota bacterium]MCB9244245.1 DUF3996 domain-containing protein [Ignavibacteriales bacterium]
MKKIIFATLFILLASTLSFGQTNSFGVGIIVGEPTGLSMKLRLSENTAIDGALGWSFEDKGSLHIHGDFLLHDYSLIHVDEGRLPIYYGIGGRIKLKNENKGNDDDRIGVRVPVGLAYEFSSRKADIFLEIVPILDLTPESQVSFNAALGARYYF